MSTTTSSVTSSSSTIGQSILQSLGESSDIDVTDLATQLTTAEMTAANNRVSREQDDIDTQISALSSLKSAISTFQDSLEQLTSSSAGFDKRSVASSDEDVVTATGSSSAAVGSYDIKVKQLAKAEQLVSNTFADGASATVGTGTLTLSLGGQSFSVTIDSSNNTLSGIRDAINDATGNTGISATLVYGSSGAQLVLTSSKTGASNNITVSQSGGDGGLSALAYSSTDTNNYTVKQTAQDSIIEIAGVEHQASTNTVTDAIDGLTLTLNKAQADEDDAVTLTVSNDTENVKTLVQSFVDAYNTLQSSLQSLGGYDSDAKTVGVMIGDGLYTSLQNQISSALTQAVSGTSTLYNTLSSLGITKQSDGTLELDSDVLSNALNSDFSSVVKTLNGSDGIVTRLDSIMDAELDSDGPIEARNVNLDKRQGEVDDEQTAIDARTQKVYDRYLAKFNAMETLLNKMQNISDYLTEQFKALNKSDS